eukprot:scaffold26454_cov78-Skeletonema_dohrnii-CCMP3373.AAC.2
MAKIRPLTALESGAGEVALLLPPPSHDNDNETDTFKSFPHTRHSDNDKYIVISITSVKNSLKNILTYGSLLYIDRISIGPLLKK